MSNSENRKKRANRLGHGGVRDKEVQWSPTTTSSFWVLTWCWVLAEAKSGSSLSSPIMVVFAHNWPVSCLPKVAWCVKSLFLETSSFSAWHQAFTFFFFSSLSFLEKFQLLIAKETGATVSQEYPHTCCQTYFLESQCPIFSNYLF